MDFEQAVTMIDNVLASLQMARADTLKLMQAVQIVRQDHERQAVRIAELERARTKATDVPAYRKGGD